MTAMPLPPHQRRGLGVSLDEILGKAPPPAPGMSAGFDQSAPKKPGFMAPGSKGAMIAGIIGDSLASVTGGQPVFMQSMMEERRRKADSEASEAQWHQRRMAGREDKQWEWENKPQDAPAPTEFERVLTASGVQPGSPEWIKAMGQRAQNIANPDPFMTTTFGNGQVYAGPRSGLADALGGGQAAPVAPVGKLTPIDGGQTATPSATFPGAVRGLSGEQVTSTYRDPAHNRRVGGVANSYHTKKDARGNPMARDSVPPPGMSMSAYAEQLRRMNPWAQVINEGDHVHIEPRG